MQTAKQKYKVREAAFAKLLQKQERAEMVISQLRLATFTLAVAGNNLAFPGGRPAG
jgi:hypothetical protein